MKKTLSSAVAALVVLCFALCLSGCGMERISDEVALPLQSVIDAIEDGNTETYLSAFPAKYTEEITGVYETYEIPKFDKPDGYNFNDYMHDFLVSVLDSFEFSYGDKIGMQFSVGKKTFKTKDELPDYFESYNDYWIPLEFEIEDIAVEEICLVDGEFLVVGNDGKKTSDASFVFIKVGGEWFLHPVYFFSTVG